MRTKKSIAALAFMLLMPTSALCLSPQKIVLPKTIPHVIPQQQSGSPTQSCIDPNSFIDVDAWPKNQRLPNIQNELTNFASRLKDNVYQLCFQMIDVLPIEDIAGDAALVLDATGAQHDIHIVGLKLMRKDNVNDKPILKTLNNTDKKVVLRDNSLSNVINGIVTEGSGKTEIIGSTITGDANKSGKGIHVKSNGAVIKGADISGCGEGVLIEADDVLLGAADKDHVNTDMNTIHDNVLGIHVGSGDRNKFPFNLVYDNKQLLAQKGAAQDAIAIEQDANEKLIPLEIELFDHEGKKYALSCTRDNANNVIQREIQFNVPQQNGIATLYAADKDVSQPMKYLTTCTLDAQGACIIKDLPPDVMALIKPGACGVEQYFVTALFTGTSSTELLPSAVEFDLKFSSITATPVEVPGPVAGVTGSSGPSDSFEPGGGSSDDDTQVATVMSGDMADGGAPGSGGCGAKGGASLLGVQPYPFAWGIDGLCFLLAFVSLVGLRLVTVRSSSR